MNYRHSFHAGNFADLVKHTLVLWLLGQRQAAGPVAVLDTHAGAGLYDLTGDATRSREAEAGVARLMAHGNRLPSPGGGRAGDGVEATRHREASTPGFGHRVNANNRQESASTPPNPPPPGEGFQTLAEGLPPLIAALADQVRAVNPDGGVRFYPGSPVLIARALRPDDRYLGFELREEVQALLADSLSAWPEAQSAGGDGYDGVLAAAAQVTGPLVLIDPPFERPDDYVRSAETAVALLRADPATTVAIWTPLKDMETFDGFLRRLSGIGPVLIAEARLRPLTNPMKMNGCAMVVVNPPEGTEAAAREICEWVAEVLGDAGAKAEVWSI